MFSIALKLKVKPGGYAGYKNAHDHLWPELAKQMKQCEVSMAIYRDGETLFVFATAPSESAWMRSRHDPILKEWNDYMTAFLEADESGGILCAALEKSFGFGDYS